MSTVSESKLAPIRANAQLSSRPTSAAGKVKVSLNAVKTGFTGRTVLLPADDVATYQATVARFTAHWNPQTEDERVLVQGLADNEWRTQRIPSLEYGIFAMGEHEFAEEFSDEPDAGARRTLIHTKIVLVYAKQLLNLQSQEARLRRQRSQDEERLERLQSIRKSREASRQTEVGFDFANF